MLATALVPKMAQVPEEAVVLPVSAEVSTLEQSSQVVASLEQESLVLVFMEMASLASETLLYVKASGQDNLVRQQQRYLQCPLRR